jgi:hypothetical protein
MGLLACAAAFLVGRCRRLGVYLAIAIAALSIVSSIVQGGSPVVRIAVLGGILLLLAKNWREFEGPTSAG